MLCWAVVRLYRSSIECLDCVLSEVVRDGIRLLARIVVRGYLEYDLKHFTTEV